MQVINRKGYVWYWYDEVPRYINSEDIEHLNHNMQVVNALLTANGYVIDEISDVNAPKSTPLLDVYNVLVDIERNLYRLNESEIKSANYDGVILPAVFALNKKDIKRWFEVLNDLFDILTGVSGKWGYLMLTDGYPTVESKRIIIRGDKIG